MDRDIIAKKVMLQVRQERDNGVKYRQGRVNDWHATEDLYYGKVKKTLKGRFNVPIPVMPGFVDTLMSKIDEPPILRFKQGSEADFRATMKIQAFHDAISKSEDNDFASKDLDAKKLAIFSGRAIMKCYGESKPKFKFCSYVTDHYDFYIDPVAGGFMENARYMGEENIFKSKSALKQGAADGIYDKKNVELLINGLAENVIKENDDIQRNKTNRHAALGLSNSMYNFMGEGTLKFIESATIIDGVRTYVLWHYETGLWIRCEPVKPMFESELWWWISWAPYRDHFNFWSKAPADDVRPVAEVIKILVNQELDNRQKRNWGMRAYDPEMFPNGAELEYRPGGLVAVKAGSSVTRAIGNGVYTFETPELQGSINLAEWLDNFVGKKSGITSDTQGQSDEAKVGIYQGNLQQVADRLGLVNKSYNKFHSAYGRRFVWACKEHLNKAQAVKLIGENGVEWDTLKGNEVDPNVDIVVESSVSEVQLSEAKKSKRNESLTAIQSNPELAKSVNKKWLIEQILLSGEFSDEDVRVALDTENNGSREVLARASEAIEQIVQGKEPKIFRGATTGFQQKILDYAMDNTDEDLGLFKRLIAYSQAHDQIVIENMNRRAMAMRAQQGMGIPPASGPDGTPPANGPMSGEPPMSLGERMPEMAGMGPAPSSAPVSASAY